MIKINETTTEKEKIMQIKDQLEKKRFVLGLGSNNNVYYPLLGDPYRVTLKYKGTEMLLVPEFFNIRDKDVKYSFFKITFRYNFFGKKEILSEEGEKAICAYITKNLFPSLGGWCASVKDGFDYIIDTKNNPLKILSILDVIEKLPKVVKGIKTVGRVKRI